MLSSSRNEEKLEARFATRLDVLLERVDTLASTVATTASGLAKKDGEIAALQRALEARDQTLQALVQHVNRSAQAPTADASVDANELRSLRNAVAALAKERASGVNAAHIEGLVTTVRALTERVNDLTTAAAAPSAPVPDPAVNSRVDAVEAELAVLRTAAQGLQEELAATLATLRARVDGLAEREPGVTEEQLEQRVAATSDAVAALRRRLDGLDETTARRLDTVAAQSDRVDSLAGKVEELEGRRSSDDTALDRRFTESDEALAKVSHRLEAIASELARSHSVDDETLDRRFVETEDALATLAGRMDAFQSVEQDELDRRFDERDEAFATLATRLDTLAETVEAAASSLGEKERELSLLQLHVNESSARIESIVDDIREALRAFPEPSVTSIDDLAGRLERLETAARKTNETSARAAGELSGRIDVIDQRLATVADEVSRAKTLWPVALRSLEARLEDVAHARKPEPPRAPEPQSGPAELPDDLLAGLRDSLQAMESVAAEMARASETLTEIATPDDVAGAEAPSEVPADPAPTPEPLEQFEGPKAATGGATIVPLRAGDP